MNKARRATLAGIVSAMDDVEITSIDQAESIAKGFIESLSTLCDEENEAYGNIPEAFTYTERAEIMEGNIDAFNTALDILEEATGAEDINSFLENIQEARSALDDIE